jgi:hypothetical protein
MYHLNNFTLVFCYSLLLLNIYLEEHTHFSAWTYVVSLGNYTKDILKNIFRPQTFKTFFSISKFPRFTPNFSKSKLAGVFVSVPILIIFHLLFSQINHEYSVFIADALKFIWEAIKYIINIEIIWIILKAIINAYIFFVVLSVARKLSFTQGEKDNQMGELFSTVLSLAAVLFAVFSFFQTKLIFVNFSNLPFKDVSLYAQKGFWELVFISIFGYILFLITLSQSGKVKKTLYLLTVFATELILICIYSYHKLLILQSHFGLKDQRILATVAVTLIFVTFIFSLGRVWGRVTVRTIFAMQAVGLTLATLILNIVNVDMLVTQVNPIGFYINNVKQKDYSYLLGNSFDNYSSWPQLMDEVRSQGIVMPQEEYYWGWYSSVCSTVSLQSERIKRYLPYSQYPKPYLADRYDFLESKYDNLTNQKKLQQIASFNWNEYQSYKLLKNDREKFSQFEIYLTSECKSYFENGGDQ